ncbi:MAG: molecular chaperone HtpG [Chlamydiae bacterium]|nr:molecular chaperone HtpG [Chlamydiota bacterium]
MAQGTLKIHTENILPIIKKWLYSDKDIFVRELVSNACDALYKTKVLSDSGETSVNEEEFRIDLTIDTEKRTLTISDTGIGMSSEEVEKYIAQVAFSGAEEFLGKYKSQNENDQIIGHFGLGFYSAYMVSEKVEINTLSYRNESSPVFWSCDGSSEYTIEEGTQKTRGTSITLFIDKESDEFLEESRIKSILQRYCAFLPYPIFLNGERVNHNIPLWLKPASECSDQEYLEFFRTLYPLEPDPIFWVHLNVDYPFNLKGILYFPKINKRFDWNQNTIKLFCNRVFVSENCKDLIPDYLMILKGAIDSPDIPLNVSRSYLQMDRTVRQLSTHISKKVADKLSSLYNTEKEKFLSSWSDVEVIVKLGAIQDDKFYERVKEFLVWKNLSGQWTTIEEYIERHKEAYKNKVFYTTDDKNHTHFLELYKNQNIEVLYTNSHIDTTLISFLETKIDSVKFQRIDGAIDESILDTKREKTLLDAEGKTEALQIANFFKSKLNDIDVEAKSLASDTLPAFIIIDENMRRLRDYMSLSNQPLPPGMGDKKTLVVNTNNKLITRIYGLKEKQPELAEEIIKYVYEMSLLAQKELDPNALPSFVARSSSILEKLMS